jgi:hypothetical protein
MHCGEGGVWQALVAQEGLFGDAVLADADRRCRGANDHELVEIVEGSGRDVFELGADGRAVLRQLVQCCKILVRCQQMTVGDQRRRAVRVGVEDPDGVTHLVRCRNEEAAELTAAKHPENCRGKNHRAVPGESCDESRERLTNLASPLAGER